MDQDKPSPDKLSPNKSSPGKPSSKRGSDGKKFRLRRTLNNTLFRSPIAFMGFLVLVLVLCLLLAVLFSAPKEPNSLIVYSPKFKETSLDLRYPFQPCTLPLQTAERETLLGLGALRYMDSSEDGETVVTLSGWGIFVWRWQENPGAPVLWCPILDTCIDSMDLSPDGRYLAAGTSEHVLLVWDTREWKQILAVDAYIDGSIQNVLFSPDSQNIVTASDRGALKLWDEKTGKIIRSFRTQGFLGKSVLDFSKDGRFLSALVGIDKVVLWNRLTGENEVTLWNSSMIPIHSFQFMPDSRKILVGGGNYGLVEIDFLNDPGMSDFLKSDRTFAGHKREILCFDFTRDGKRMITGSMDGTAKVWDLESRKVVASIGEENLRLTKDAKRNDISNEVIHVHYFPDGNRVWIGNRNGTIQIYDLAQNRPMTQLSGHVSWVANYALTKNGDRAILGGSDGRIRIQDMSTGAQRILPIGHDDYVASIVLSPSETHLASLDRVGYVHLYDLQKGERLQRWGQGDGAFEEQYGSILFSGDGKQLGLLDTLWDIDEANDYLKWKWIDVESLQIRSIWKYRKKNREGMFENGRLNFFHVYPTPSLVVLNNGEVEKPLDTIRTVDGNDIFVTSMNETQSWDFASGQLVSKPFLEKIYGIPSAFSPDGNWMALSGMKLELVSWRGAEQMFPLSSWPGAEQRFSLSEYSGGGYFRKDAVAFSEDGKWLASGSSDGEIRIWDVASREILYSLHISNQSIRIVRFISTNTKLLIGTNEGIRMRNIADLKKFEAGK